MSSIEIGPISTTSSNGGVVGGTAAPARLRTFAIAAGILAGLASWLAGEAVHGRFRPPLASSPGIPTASEAASATARRRSAEIGGAAAAFGLSGLALGAALGAAGGLAARPRGRLKLASVGGGLAAGALGALGAAAGVLIAPQPQAPGGDDLVPALLLQGSIAALIGAAAGATLALGAGLERRDVLRTAAGGLIGAATGIAIYQFLGALVFPLAETSKPVAAAPAARLAAHLLLAVGAAGAASLMYEPGRSGDPAVS